MNQKNDSMNQDISSSLDKGLTLLLEFSKSSDELGISDLSNKTKLPVSTISRTLAILVRRGFVMQNPKNKKYGLGFVMKKFASLEGDKTILKNVSKEILLELRDKTNETSLLYVRNGSYREHVCCVESFEELRISKPINSFAPLHAGSASRILWAFEPEDKIVQLLSSIELSDLTDKTICDKAELIREAALIRARGYAVSRGERNQGVCSISAPVYNSSNMVIAAVSVSMPQVRFDDSTEGKISPKVVWAGMAISQQLNYSNVD